MNVGVQIARCHPDFNSSEYLSRSGIVGSYGSSPFKFLWNIHTIFQSSGAVSHSYPQCIKVQFLHILLNLVSFSFLLPMLYNTFFFFFFFLIYLAVLGLEAHRILVPGLGIALTCPALQGGFSTTGPPGSPSCFFFFFYDISHSDRYELIPHWGFDLHFPDDYWLLMLNIFSYTLWLFVVFL